MVNSHHATWTRLLLGAAVAILTLTTSAKTATVEEISKQLDQFVDSGDTTGFQRFADENTCLLNPALTWILRKYISSRYSAPSDKLRKARTHISLLLRRGTGISAYHRSLSQAVLDSWKKSDFDTYQRAAVLRRIAVRPNTPNGEDTLRESSRLFGKLHCSDQIAENEYAYGNLLYTSERYKEAVPRFREALRLGMEIDDVDLLCRAHLGLAATLGQLDGQFSAAVEEAERARRIINRCQLHPYLVNYFQRLGVIYFYLSDFRSAQSRFRAADSVANAMSSPMERLYPLRQLALCYQERGLREEADSVFSVGICLAQENNRPADVSWMTVYQADIRIETMDTIGMRNRLLEARDVFLAAKDKEGVANATYQLGRLQARAGQPQEALVALRAALDSLVDEKGRIFPAKELGLTFLQRGLADSALFFLQVSAELLDSVRASVPRAALRRNYLRDKDDIVHGLVQAYLRKGDTLSALDAAEAYRARAFHEALEEKRIQSDLPRSYARDGDRIRDRLTGILRGIRNCSFALSDSNQLEDQLDATQDSLTDLYLRASTKMPLRSRLHPSDYRWFLSSTDSGVVSLYYFVHKDDFFVWYSDGITSKARRISDDCPDIRRRIESALKLLTHRPVLKNDLADLEDTLNGLDCLLPKDVRDRLPSLSGLRIYPNGILCYLPFETIRFGGTYLGEILPIEYFPSLSIAEYQSRTRGRKNSLETVAVFGGGHFKGAENCCQSLSRIPKAFTGLEDLPGAEQEAGAIKAAFGGGVTEFLDTPDQERTVRTRNLKDFDVLHFVAHGVMQDDNPQFSGLVLPHSPESKEDGILLTDDISSLNINSSLVVLSACETGLGSYAGGEGILGLSRSFVIAGARSLVVSLWPIDDASSGFFMERFYHAIKDGQSTGKALWTARRQLVTETTFKHPYYWAPLIALGDWK